MTLRDPSITSRLPADVGVEPDPTGTRGEATRLARAFDRAHLDAHSHQVIATMPAWAEAER